MAAIALFVLAAPSDATAVASLHEDCVDIFIRCVNSPDTNVSFKSIANIYVQYFWYHVDVAFKAGNFDCSETEIYLYLFLMKQFS